MTASTIVALATARGKSAIAIIRVSGPATRFVVETIAGHLPRPRKAELRALGVTASGRAIDNGLVIWFASPHSYTGEDSAEFHVHGGPAIINALMSLLLSLQDVRLAEAGEFTKRAVLNNKLDLASAEAVSDLIAAETELQRRQALNQLDGALTRACEMWQSQLVGALALLESGLDFSDEADIPASLSARIESAVRAVITEIEHALAQANYGERIREGFRVAILGAPNAGKSTLLNQLSKRDIAIVTAIPGTTRDALEVACDIDGLPIVFIDTAGLRESTDPIETIGIARARLHAGQADLILWLVAPGSEDGQRQDADFDAGKRVVVGTKSDLGMSYPYATDVDISAHSGDGLAQLRQIISQRLGNQSAGDVLINRQRHRTALEDAHAALLRALSVTHIEELYAEDIRLAIRAIGRVVGMVDLDSVLDRVFSEFCIGK